MSAQGSRLSMYDVCVDRRGQKKAEKGVTGSVRQQRCTNAQHTAAHGLVQSLYGVSAGIT
jgi:hypothetical protein